MSQPPITCYHICYDDQTKESCPPEFTPLYHENQYPDFKEIFPIMNCLLEREWKEGEFVGFFSPKFSQKTGLSPKSVFDALGKYGKTNMVICFTSYWEFAAYWLNPWEQADYSNPGVLEISQALADKINANIDLMSACVSMNKVAFSHFLIAPRPFWDEWLRITQIYLELLSSSKELAERRTDYRGSSHLIHPFIIERVPTLILLINDFASIQFMDEIYAAPDMKQKTNLFRMDQFKKDFSRDGKQRTLDQYWEYRIAFSKGGQIFTKTAQHFLKHRNIKVTERSVTIS